MSKVSVCDGTVVSTRNPNIINSAQCPCFEKLRRYIFDDFETVEEDYHKHDETFVVIVAEIDLACAEEILERLPNCGYSKEELVGHWGGEYFPHLQ